MEKRSFLFVVLAAVIGISLSGCGSTVQLKKEEIVIPPPQAKVAAPETKKEIPVSAAPAPEVKKEEAVPQSVPSPAPQKKKKG